MTEELQRVAAAFIRDHALDTEFLDVVETCDFLTDAECHVVYDLIARARIHVSWEGVS